MPVAHNAYARRQRATRRVRRCRARKAEGVVLLPLAVRNLPALAQVLIEAQWLPEADRANRQKVTAALQKALAEWCEM